MARIAFAFTVVLKVVMWALQLSGIALGVWALIQGEVVVGLVILVVVVPVLLAIATMALGLVQAVLLFPIAALLGRTREFLEYSNFTNAVVDDIGADRLTLRQGRQIVRMFRELPSGERGTPARSGGELLGLYESLHDWRALDEQFDAPPVIG